jgi:membrane protein implicated in regulation of membrane protease activity
MSKKTNTIWFILGATIVNILITLIIFVLLFMFYIRFLIPKLPEAVAAWGFPILFVLSIVLSFFIYRFFLKLLMKRINLEDHFDPLFGRRRR